MFQSHRCPPLPLFYGLFLILGSARAAVPIDGVSDESVYSPQTAFRVPAEAGYEYDVTLNGVPMPTSVFVDVDRPDYYQLVVRRTETATGNAVTESVQFVVRAAGRGSSETGLPAQVPKPLVHSAAAEFDGAQVRLLAPARFPAGLEIPIAIFVEDSAGHGVRANGVLRAAGHAPIPVRRGAGSGRLAANLPVGTLTYAGELAGVPAEKTIEIQGSTSWTSVSGPLDGNVTWADDSRIHVTGNLTIPAGSSLTIGAGTVVLLDLGVDIDLNGAVSINGTRADPVVFTPNNPSQPWGGFILDVATAELTAEGALFVGSGEDPNWMGDNNYNSHRDEQCLFLLANGPLLTLTDCAMFDLAGQWGHADSGAAITMDHCLVQRCTTGGEFGGASFRINDCAFIEFPVHSPEFVDGDNDGLYILNGTHGFTNCLFGWTKDDSVDAGGSGSGLVQFSRCWFEGNLHEGIAGSGNNKDIRLFDCVFLDNGQAYEAGYDGPLITANHCLSIANLTGARFGDNYDWSYSGFLRVTNSILLNNHRDVWGRNWDDWTYRLGNMDVQGNFLTAANTNHPSNQVWHPDADAVRLAAFRSAPSGHVGAAIAVWPGLGELTDLKNGVPVILSSFCTNHVLIDYRLEATDGTASTGILDFVPGEMRRYISLPSFEGVLRMTLENPQNADLTGLSKLYLTDFGTLVPSDTTLIATRSVWKYLDDGSNQGTAWRSPGFDDNSWTSGMAQLGYGDGDEQTVISYGGDELNKYITTYFRHSFNVEDRTAFGSLMLSLQRDDGAVVYLNGTEIYRSNMPGGTISYDTLAGSGTNPENDFRTATLGAAALVNGVNVVAVEVHQNDLNSSDLSFDLGLIGKPADTGLKILIGKLGDEVIPYWPDPAAVLEEADAVTGTWSPSTAKNGEPIPSPAGTKIFRLRK